MVWTGIMSDEHTDLHIFVGGFINGTRSKDIARESQVLFREATGSEFLFIDENTKPYDFQTRKYLVNENNNNNQSQAPENSLDINSIEKVQERLGQKFLLHQLLPTSITVKSKSYKPIKKFFPCSDK
ncbi:hypothetical protein TNCV_2067711 [Trichonephila clavipes]|uniref:Uncharacterized protein n=1 Tax=Trichonephila clavipes TaxID=2585209 RepID=A0A8X7BD01_TRICX|nr:hypothetical protein TNCV_2067711 [Trichonephila clavipes]